MGLLILEEVCAGLLPVFKIIRLGIFPIFQVGVPVLLLIFGSIDLGKAVMSSDEKQIKEATGKLIKRAVAAVVFFLIPMLVTLVMNIIAKGGAEGANTTSWADCWKAAGNDKTSSGNGGEA
ncbi:MAG: hypothetical protein RSD40_05770 [Bacilli bacterium]